MEGKPDEEAASPQMAALHCPRVIKSLIFAGSFSGTSSKYPELKSDPHPDPRQLTTGCHYWVEDCLIPVSGLHINNIEILSNVIYDVGNVLSLPRSPIFQVFGKPLTARSEAGGCFNCLKN